MGTSAVQAAVTARENVASARFMRKDKERIKAADAAMFDVRCLMFDLKANTTEPRRQNDCALRNADCGILWLMKPHSASRRLGRSDELLDRFEDDSELLIVFLLKRFDLAGEVAVCVHEAAELHESA